MPEELNPYKSTFAQPSMSYLSISCLFDRSVVIQLGFVLQTFLLTGYCALAAQADQPPWQAIREVSTNIQNAMAAMVLITFFSICTSALSKTSWPFLLRGYVVAIEFVLVIVLTCVARGFGMF